MKAVQGMVAGEEGERARMRLEAEVAAGLIEGGRLTEELLAAQVRAHTHTQSQTTSVSAYV